jgi:carbon storage regulator
MLVLTRRAGQSISIGDDIKIIILNNPIPVQVGIEAPKHIKILRDELIKNSSPQEDIQTISVTGKP